MIFSDVWFLSWNSLGTEPIGNHLHMSRSEENKNTNDHKSSHKPEYGLLSKRKTIDFYHG